MAIQKYGKENFDFDVLLYSDDQQYKNLIESKIIVNWNLMDSNFGYNKIQITEASPTKSKETIEMQSKSLRAFYQTPKGIEFKKRHSEQVSKTVRGQKRTEETRRNISKALTGLPKSEEHKRKLSLIRGERASNYGKPLPEKTKKALSAAVTRRWQKYREERGLDPNTPICARKYCK
jgi:NUMOD3 motif